MTRKCKPVAKQTPASGKKHLGKPVDPKGITGGSGVVAYKDGEDGVNRTRPGSIAQS